MFANNPRRLVAGVLLFAGGLSLYALIGASRPPALLSEAQGQEVVAARPVAPDQRINDQAEKEKERLRALLARQKEQIAEARALLDKGKFDEAEKLLNAILKESPDQGDAQKWIERVAAARQAKEARDKKLAEDEARRKEKERLAQLEEKLSQADGAAKRQKFDEAIKLANEVLAADPKYTQAQEKIAQWNEEKGRLQREAMSAQLRPELAQLEGEVLASLKARDFAKARQAADKMLALDPGNRTAQQLSVRIDLEQKEHEADLAEAKISAALRVAEEMAKLGRYEQAVETLKDGVLSRDPDNAGALKLMASAQREITLKKTAEEAARAAQEADAAQKAGNLEKALADYQRAEGLAKETADRALQQGIREKKRAVVAAIEAKKEEEARVLKAAEEEVSRQVKALFDEKKWDEAGKLLDAKQKDPVLQSSEAVRALAAQLPVLREKAEAAAREEAAEAAYGEALRLLAAGEVDQSEAVLRKITPAQSEKVALKAQRALEREIPRKRMELRKDAAGAELARANGLADEGKFDEAANLISDIVAKYPEVEREGNSALAKVARKKQALIDGEERKVIGEVEGLLEAQRFDDASALLRARLAEGLLKGNERLGAEIGKVAEAKAEVAEKERLAKATAAWEEALALLRGSNLDGAEAAFRKVDVGASEALAARVAKALETDLPKRRAELKKEAAEAAMRERLAKATASYDQALALFKSGDMDGAEAALKEVDAGASDALAAKVAKALETDLPKRRAELKIEAAEAAMRERLATATASYDQAVALLKGGDVDGAEAALKKVDVGASEALAARVAKALETDLPKRRVALKREAAEKGLAQAEALAAKGDFAAAEKAIQDVRKQNPDFEDEADQALARLEKSKKTFARDEERRILAEADGLVRDGRFDEATTLLSGSLTQGVLKDKDSLKGKLQQVAAAKAEAAQQARVDQAEAAYDAAMVLLASGKIDEGEAALKAVDTGVSDGLAAKVAKALEKEVPNAKVEARMSGLRAKLAEADALAKDGKFDDARKAAEQVKADEPQLARDADRILAKVERERVAQLKAQEQEALGRAESLMDAGKFDEAGDFINRTVAAGPLKGNEKLQALLAELGNAKAKAAAAAKEREAEESYAAAMTLLGAGKLEEAEQTLRKIDTEVSPELARKVARAIEKDLPAIKAEQKLAKGREELGRARALVKAGDYDQARKVAGDTKAAFPGLARDADRVLAEIDRDVQSRMRAQEKEVMGRIEALMKDGRLDDAESLIKRLTASEPLKDSAALQAALAEVAVKKVEVAKAAAAAKAQEQYNAAMALAAAGKHDEAETALRAIKGEVPGSLASKIARALERDLPRLRAAEREALGNAELEKAQALFTDGKLLEARKIAVDAKEKFPEVSRAADRLLAKVAGERRKQTRGQEDEAIAKAKDLVAQGQLDEAEQFLAGAFAEGPLQENEGLRKMLASVTEMKESAARAAVLKKAEADLARAEALVKEGKLEDAEKVLQAVPAEASKGIASKVDRMLNWEIPKVRREQQVAEGRQQLARAKGLLEEKRLAAARNIARGVKATFPPEVGRDAEALIAEADEAAKAQADELVAANQFDEAGKLIEQYLEGTPDEGATGLRQLLAKLPALREEGTRSAKSRQLENQYNAAMESLAGGDLDGSEKALEQLLADSDLTDKLAAKVRKALEQGVPQRRAALKEGAINQQLQQIVGLVEQGETVKAKAALRSFITENPGFEKQTRGVQKAIDAKEKERVAAIERDAVQKVEGLIAQGQFDQALTQADDFLSNPELTESTALRKLRMGIPEAKREAELGALTAEAQKLLAQAESLIGEGREDEAEKILGGIDRTVSKDVARKVENLLNNEIPALKEKRVADAAEAKLAEAAKALADGELDEAKTAAEAAMKQHASVEKAAKGIVAQVEEQKLAALREARRGDLEKADKLVEDGQFEEGVAIYRQLQEAGVFTQEVAARLAKIGRTTPGIEAGHAAKVAELFKVAEEAHAEKLYRDEQAAYEAVLVWDPENPEAKRRLADIRANRKELEAKLAKDAEARRIAEKTAEAFTAGRKLEDAHRIEEALAKYREVIQLDPKNRPALSAVRRLTDTRDRRKDSLIVAINAQRLQRQQLVNKWLGEAQQLSQARRYNEAENLVNRVIALEGTSEKCQLVQAEIDRGRSGKVATGRKLGPIEDGIDVEKEPTDDEDEPVIDDGAVEVIPEGVDVEQWRRAKELLTKISEQKTIEIQQRDFTVKTLCDQAEKLLDEGKFDEAGKKLREADKENREDERVKALKARLHLLTGIRPTGVPDLKADRERRDEVRTQMNIEEMEKLFKEGNAFLEKREYNRAIDSYEKVRTILRTLPDREQLSVYREESDRLLATARSEQQAEADRIEELQKEQAERILRTQRGDLVEQERRQREGLLSAARRAMEQENYGLSEDYIRQLLAIDPLNSEAKSLRAQLGRGQRYDRITAAREAQAGNKEELLVMAKEAALPQTTLYEYPSNWQDIIAKRPESQILEEADPEWKKVVKEQMEKRISFDFVDTPLADVVAFLNNLTGVNMVLDPAAVEGDDVPVTLKVNDMRLGAALEGP